MVSHFSSIHGDLPQVHRQSGRSNIGQGQKRRGKRWCLILCHVAQIVVNELIFKLLCSYQQENQAWEKEKEEEEEIRQWGLISPSCLIHANKGKHPKQAISENHTNDQRSRAAPWHTVYHICMDIHIHTDMRMSNAIQIRKMYNLDILRIVLQSRQVQFARRVSWWRSDEYQADIVSSREVLSCSEHSTKDSILHTFSTAWYCRYSSWLSYRPRTVIRRIGTAALKLPHFMSHSRTRVIPLPRFQGAWKDPTLDVK